MKYPLVWCFVVSCIIPNVILEAGESGIIAADARASSERVSIPLAVNLTIVTIATGQPQGEFETIKQVTEITPDLVHFTYTADKKSDDEDRLRLQRVQRKLDLLHAFNINTRFSKQQPQEIAGATSFTCSTDVLTHLKSKGSVNIGHIVGERGSDVRYSVTLQRTGKASAPYPVVLNGLATSLRAIHAKSAPGDEDQVEMYILDDPQNPVLLFWESSVRKGPKFGARITKIEFPHTLEDRLRNDQRVDVYGIYFDFGSDHLRPESGPVLQEIAGVLTNNPDWRLKVEGHTDNVAEDAFNLDLSRRRAEAVKQALVDQYQIAPERLTTAGHGESRPRATNDTPVGRALNRRVELVRE